MRYLVRLCTLVATATALVLGAASPAFAGPPGGWNAILQCESGNRNVDTNPHSSASGYWQIIDGTWKAYGGKEFAPRAVQASRAEQLIVAERIYADVGSSAWECAK